MRILQDAIASYILNELVFNAKDVHIIIVASINFPHLNILPTSSSCAHFGESLTLNCPWDDEKIVFRSILAIFSWHCPTLKTRSRVEKFLFPELFVHIIIITCEIKKNFPIALLSGLGRRNVNKTIFYLFFFLFLALWEKSFACFLSACKYSRKKNHRRSPFPRKTRRGEAPAKLLLLHHHLLLPSESSFFFIIILSYSAS